MRPHTDGELVARVYGDTQTLRAASAVLQCAPTTVGRRLASIGVPRGPARRRRRPAFPQGQAEEIIARYRNEQDPASLAVLARDYGRSEGTIRRLLAFEGVPIRPRGRLRGPTPPLPPVTAVVRLHQSGQRPAVIAAELNCDRQDVLRVLRAQGLPANRSRPLPDAAQLREDGESVRALARRYHVSEKRIRAALEDPAPASAPSGGHRPG